MEATEPLLMTANTIKQQWKLNKKKLKWHLNLLFKQSVMFSPFVDWSVVVFVASGVQREQSPMCSKLLSVAFQNECIILDFFTTKACQNKSWIFHRGQFMTDCFFMKGTLVCCILTYDLFISCHHKPNGALLLFHKTNNYLSTFIYNAVLLGQLCEPSCQQRCPIDTSDGYNKT